MVDGATTEQLQTLVNENDTESSIADSLTEAMDDAGMTFIDDPIKPDAEESAAEEEDTDDAPTEKVEDKPEKEESDEEESVPEKEASEDSPSDSDQEKTDQAKEKGEEDAPGSLTPPSSWSAEEKAEFADLPSKVQNVILRREGDRDRLMNQKTAELNQTTKRYADLDQVLDHNQLNDRLAMTGMTPAKLLSGYIATSQQLATNPVEAIKYLAQQYGVDLSKLNEAASEEEASPEVLALREQVEATNARLNTFTSSQEEQETAYKRQRQTELAGTLDGFANEADAAGNLTHPHFNDLRRTMGSIMSASIEAEQPVTMEDAYQQALWANPSHREALLAQQTKAEQGKAEVKRKAHAKKATKAGVSVASSPGGGATPKPQGSVNEELNRAWDDAAQ